MNIIIGCIIITSIFANDTDSKISFQYGMLGRLESTNNQIIELQDSSTIHSGDEIRINVGYNKGTHLHVIYKGSAGEFILLYPEESELVDNVTDLPETIYATVLHWSPLSDPIGFETFFLINSNLELENLLALFKRYNKVNERGKTKLAKKIQNELDLLNPETKQDLASISSRLDEAVVGGVAFRGDDGAELKDMSLTHFCSGKLGIAFKEIILNHQ
jgi:hypothetical protein